MSAAPAVPRERRGDHDSDGPSISSDARFVAFTSAANNLSTEDNDTYANVFVRDVLGSPAGPPGAGPDTTGPAVSSSRLTRANGTIRVDRRRRRRRRRSAASREG